MGEGFGYDVFISHSSKDKGVARDLAGRLRDDGLRVWLDEWVIRPGDMIGQQIERGLEGSRTLVLLMSEHAFASDWVGLERHTLIFRDPTNAERRFLPVLIADCRIPDMIAQFAYVDWRGRSGEGYAGIRSACEGEAEAVRPLMTISNSHFEKGTEFRDWPKRFFVPVSNQNFRFWAIFETNNTKFNVKSRIRCR